MVAMPALFTKAKAAMMACIAPSMMPVKMDNAKACPATAQMVWFHVNRLTAMKQRTAAMFTTFLTAVFVGTICIALSTTTVSRANARASRANALNPKLPASKRNATKTRMTATSCLPLRVKAVTIINFAQSTILVSTACALAKPETAVNWIQNVLAVSATKIRRLASNNR